MGVPFRKRRRTAWGLRIRILGGLEPTSCCLGFKGWDLRSTQGAQYGLIKEYGLNYMGPRA